MAVRKVRRQTSAVGAYAREIRACGCNQLTRLRVVIDVADGRRSVADTAVGLIGVGRKQVYRLFQVVSGKFCKRR